jgi:hypothetical protein
VQSVPETEKQMNNHVIMNENIIAIRGFSVYINDLGSLEPMPNQIYRGSTRQLFWYCQVSTRNWGQINREITIQKYICKKFSYLVANATLFGYLFHRYRYNMEVDEENIDTYNISVGVCLWFCWLDVVLKLGCIGAVLV